MEITLNKIKSSLINIEIVSFDIFDTLLSRKIGAPVDVFELVRSKLLMDDIVLKCHDTMMNYPHLRRLSESEARKVSQKEFENESEVTLDEIYSIFKKKTNIDDEMISLLKNTELEVESFVLYAPNIAREIFKLIRKNQIKIIAISDMYLPKQYLHKLLISNGYDISLDEIFVSGEERYSKHTGNLYKKVNKNLNISFEKWLHIGDNLHADIKNASSHGIQTFHANWSSVENIHIPSSAQINDYSISSIIDFLDTKQANEFFPLDEWSKIGYKTFGPLIFGYMVWLLSQLKSNKIDKALFMARDAYMILKLYKEYFQQYNSSISFEYIYASRASLYPISITDWPMHKIWHFFGGKSKRTVRQVFSMLGLDVDLHISDIYQVGFLSPDDIITDEQGHKMHTLINRLYFQIMQKSKENRETFSQYFIDIIQDSKNIALIDIGWSGNIQAAFSRAICDKWSDINLSGFYLGLFSSAGQNISPYNPMKGWITSLSTNWNIEHELTQDGGVEILEFVLTANHGSTLGYESVNGKINPILEKLENESEYNTNAMKLQSGIIKYFEDHQYLLDNFSLESLLSHEWIKPFMRLLKEPTKQEAEMLGNLTHSDTAGENSIRHYLSPKVSENDKKTKNAIYQNALKESFWKTGFIVRNS